MRATPFRLMHAPWSSLARPRTLHTCCCRAPARRVRGCTVSAALPNSPQVRVLVIGSGLTSYSGQILRLAWHVVFADMLWASAANCNPGNPASNDAQRVTHQGPVAVAAAQYMSTCLQPARVYMFVRLSWATTWPSLPGGER